MKAKTISCLSVCCAVSMFVASAYANTTTNWFGMSASGTELNLTNATATTNNVPISVAEDKIELENDIDTPLTIFPSVDEPAVSDGLVKIKSTSIITPCPVGELPADVGEAKAGFTVAYNGAVTNFYGYASGYASGNWFPLSGAVPGDGATTFTIALDYRTNKVSFYVGDVILAYDNATAFTFSNSESAKSLANLAVYGTGKIGSIATDCEVAVAAYNNRKYGSVAEAMVAAGENVDSVAPVSSTGTVDEEPTAAAANGLKKWQCVALGIAETKQVELTPATKQNSGMITLAAGVNPDAGLNVKFTVNGEGSYDYDDIQIPMAKGTYKIAPTITVAQ